MADGGQIYTRFQKRYARGVLLATRMESFLSQVGRVITGLRQTPPGMYRIPKLDNDAPRCVGDVLSSRTLIHCGLNR
jgi:hypothetical protein